MIKLLVFLIVFVLCAVMEEKLSHARSSLTVRVFPIVILQRSDVKVDAQWQVAGGRYVALDWTSSVSGGNSTREVDVDQHSAEWTLRDMPPVDTWFVVTLYGERNRVLASERGRLAGPGGR